MDAPFRIDSYDWAGGREAMLRFGPDGGPVVVAAMPLFAEANRLRAFAVSILRALAARGIGGVLPDLPGTGESAVATRDARLSDMRRAYATLAARLGERRRPCALGLRSGALLDAGAPVALRWHFAPQPGDAMLREMWRVRQASTGDRSAFATFVVAGGGGDRVDFAGDTVSRQMIAELIAASPEGGSAPLRVVRLDTDVPPADRKLPGTPLWRRVEPGNDPALAERLAEDLAEWIHACGT